jgi:hypothetical protein
MLAEVALKALRAVALSRQLAAALLQAYPVPHRTAGAGDRGGHRIGLLNEVGDHAYEPHGVEPDATPLVEREHEHELGLLAGALRRVVRDRTPQLVTILGQAGIGKSRQAVMVPVEVFDELTPASA